MGEPHDDSGLRITSVRVRPINKAVLKAFVSVTLNDSLVLHDMRIIQTPQHTFVAMPRSHGGLGPRGSDVYHPTHQGFRTRLEAAVLQAWRDIAG